MRKRYEGPGAMEAVTSVELENSQSSGSVLLEPAAYLVQCSDLAGVGWEYCLRLWG